MNKYDLLVSVHQIETAAIKLDCPEIAEFCRNIFDQLTEDEFVKYHKRLALKLKQKVR